VIPIGNPPGAAADGLSLNPIARAADIKVSVSHGEFSCGSASPTLDLPLSLSPSLDAEIHKPLFGNLTVKFVIGINGSLGLHLVVPEGAGCDVTLGKLGPWPIGVIPIGPIEIPVSAELEGKASLTLDGPLTISANASLTSHAGFTYANGHLGGVFDATPSGNATVDFHGGNFQIGPELKISAGLADALDANVSAGLFDTLKGSSASAWGLGLTFSVEAGLEAEGIGSLSTTVADKYFPLASYGIPGE
jgi:hypothetical protein